MSQMSQIRSLYRALFKRSANIHVSKLRFAVVWLGQIQNLDTGPVDILSLKSGSEQFSISGINLSGWRGLGGLNNFVFVCAQKFATMFEQEYQAKHILCDGSAKFQAIGVGSKTAKLGKFGIVPGAHTLASGCSASQLFLDL